MNISSLNRMITLIGRVADRRHSTVPFVTPTADKPLFPGTAGDRLPRVTPEEAGVSSRTLAAFFRALADEPTLNMHSVMVLRNGRVLAEATFGDRSTMGWQMTFSASKSIVSLAVGLLADEGRLRVTDRVIDFFGTQVSPLARLKWHDLTVEDLLTMRSAASFNEGEAVCEADWVKAFFASSLRGTLGETFHYNSLNTYMLAAIVRQITGQGLCDFLRPRLFDPLGIGEVFWEPCPAGVEKGGWGLYICPEDMAKLGQLVMDHGMWRGERLISEEWIAAATAAHAAAPESYGDYDYGYQIWSGRSQPRFLFNGMLGQNVIGFWENGILLVSNAGNNEMFQQSRYFDLAHEAFGGTFPDALPQDAAAQRELADTLTGLRTVYPSPPRGSWRQRLLGQRPDWLPALCRQLDGRIFTAGEDAAAVGLLPVSLQLVTNRYAAGLCAVRFAVEDEVPVAYFDEGEAENRLPVGLYAPQQTVLTFGGDRYAATVSGRCLTDEEDHPVLFLRVEFSETPYTRRLKFTFCGNGLRLELGETPGEDFIWTFAQGTLDDAKWAQPLAGTLQKWDLDYVRYKLERLFKPRLTLFEKK